MIEKIRSGLYRQILSFALLTAIPGLGILGWHLATEWKHAVETGQLESKVVVDEITRDLWGIFRDFREVVGEISRRPQVRALDSTHCDPILRDYAALHSEVAAITVRDLQGTILCSSAASPAAHLPKSQEPLLSNTVASDGFSISGVEWGPSSHKWVVALTFPVRDNTDKIEAVLFLTLDLVEYSERILSSLPENSAVTILDRENLVAMRSSDIQSWIGKPFPARIRTSGSQEAEGFLRSRDPQGRAYLGAFVTEPFSGWTIESTIPEDVVLGPQKKQMALAITGTVIVSVLFCAALLIAAGNIARPLQALARTARLVAGGDRDARAPEHGASEIKLVARQFNTMLEGIELQRKEVAAAGEKTMLVLKQLMRLEEVGAVGGFEQSFETGGFTLTPGSCRILDLDPSDAISIQEYVSSGRFITPEFEAALKQAARDLKPWNIDTLVETAVGRKRWLHTRGEAELRSGQVVGLVGHIRDITEGVEASRDAAVLAAIVESSEDAIIGKSLSGTVTAWNAAAARLFGYSAEEMVGQSIGKLIPPELRHEEATILSGLAGGDAIKHFETVRLKKDGRRVDVSLTISPIRDTRGVLVGASKIARDITERKQMDLRLRSIIEASPVPYAISDNQRNIVYINQAFIRTFGYEIEEIQTYSQWSQLLFPDPGHLAAFENNRAEHTSDLQEGKIAAPVELTLVAKDQRVVLTICALAKLPGLALGERLIALQDITELKVAQNRLRDAQKMEAFGRLASGIAHDFNNLLGVIGASTELLQDQDRLHQDTSNSTRLILRACERGADLTRRLLIFSRKSNPRPEPVNVSQVMDDLVAVLRRTLGGHITVELSVRCDDPCVFVDATLFHTALYNLAVNARDAMPHGGTLSFTVSRQRGQIGEAPEGEIVVISARDSGTGMSSDVARQIFDPFFTTKEAGKGTGLGLSMVYGFVTEAAGDIRVESALNKGTTFTLRFPSSRLTASAVNNVEAYDPILLKGRTLLLVEDDRDLRDATSARLSRLGLSVHAAASTRDALSLVASQKDFDILLTDFRLGESVNGAQLAREVRALVPGISVVVMSGYLGVEDARSLDPDWVLLEKPVTTEELVRAFHQRSL